jgi:type I restriction enzyme M protein
MLSQETKKHIDAARQILVGVVPNPMSQVEQITNALIYKFMDDMDQQAIKAGGDPSFFTGDLEKYAWTKLMSNRLGNQERTNIYTEALIKFSESKQLPQLFRDIFRQAFLPYRDPEVLGLFLKEISYFDYTHSEELGNAYEYLLSIMSSQGDAGQFRTPRHIIDFIVDVVAPTKDDTILDPACGTAGFLISAYNYIKRQNEGVDSETGKVKQLTSDQRRKLISNFQGYDIDPTMVRMSQVNMYLHKFTAPKIYNYNTLASEERWNDKFDVILANPPFMSPKGGVKPHNKFSIQANRTKVLFVDYIMNHLRPKGRAGMIVPEGVIFQSGKAYKELRKNLVEDGLFAVVSLPAGVFNPYSGVKTSILFFDNEVAKKTKELLFVKVLHDGYDLGAQRRKIEKNDLGNATILLKGFREYVRNDQSQETIESFIGSSGKGSLVPKEKIAETDDYNLSADKYAISFETGNTKWSTVELGSVTEILNGYAFKSENYVDSGVRVIRITNVQKGKIVDNNPKFYPLDTIEPIERFKLKEGDLLISLTGNVGRVGILPKDLLPAALNQRVACLRVISDNLDPRFLFSLLNKDTFENECIKNSSGVAQKNLSTVWLSKYQIPLPPLEVQKEIIEQIEVKQNAIEGAKQVIENLERERDDILANHLGT